MTHRERALRRGDERDPFRIRGPAVISFSGGRTSGYMLWRILQAHDGVLPDGVHVVFANTGRERAETLAFVAACEARWRVPITCVEWRREAPGFACVDAVSASRNGEPFADLIAHKQALPNLMRRFCTQFLKVAAINAYMASRGFTADAFINVIGLRADEGWRILKGLEGAERNNRQVAYPLARAHVRKREVMRFWHQNDFDLMLDPWEGNCDLCFLKSRKLRKHTLNYRPDLAAWWIAQEEAQGRTFDASGSVKDLLTENFADWGLDPSQAASLDGVEYDVECGLTCAFEDTEA